jgi:hypothetical protein
MKTLACALLGVSLLGCHPPQKKTMTQEQMAAADPLPLAKGAKWTFDVTVKRYDPDAAKEITKTLSWTTEVIDAREANGVTAYRIKGWPSDLAPLEAGEQPQATETTVLRRGNDFMFGKTADPSLDGATGWFSWPVMDGQQFCPPKSDSVYCWQVAANDTGYTLTFSTGPDEQSFDLEPNTGISRFHYAHHNTTNEIEAKLAQFTPGAAHPTNPPR